jgi:uncharacterized tellurite resistance protein B-like protein
MGLGADLCRWLGIERPEHEPEVLDAVCEVLDRLTPVRARYVAAFAYLLGRVAGADVEISADERKVMERLVAQEGALSTEEASAVVMLALAEGRRFGGTHNFQVTREFSAQTTPEERMGLLRCLFAVSAADANVTVLEDNEIRGISRELRIEHPDFIRARDEVRAHLAVLRHDH